MNNKLIVDERQRDIGQFLVGRLLPFKDKRQVGPFTYIDHMGPVELEEGKFFDIDQHPHIGLSTLTYLLKGEIEHMDSIGSKQVVKPGDIAFMTSGKAVTHTERTPKTLRESGEKIIMHGYQIWVVLPKQLEDMEPNFQFFSSNEIPSKVTDDYSLKLLAGEGFGLRAPLQGYSPLFMVDITAKKTTDLALADQLSGELAIVVVEGELEADGETIKQGQMLISKTDEQCKVHLKKDTQILIFGGKPLEDDVFLLWNFVSSDKDKLEQAKQDWKAKKFPKIEEDDTYVPFPEMKLK